uniref:Syntrophin gamma 1 n=1 Tax=Monodelphis domestica TaxID=13616 RepID=A0A5F8GSM7_MONDO
IGITIWKLSTLSLPLFFFSPLKTKTGICLLQDGNQEPFKVRLHLAKDILMIQEQDVICVSGEPFYSGGTWDNILCVGFL